MMKHLLSATLILLSTLSYAEEVPNSFSSGETISSSQINANFSFLADAMGRGSVKAMMACSEMGVSDLDNPSIVNGDDFITPIITFTSCLSPDNTTVLETIQTCTFESFRYGFCISPNPQNNAIKSTDLISKGWLYIEYESGTGLYLFYKISDQ
jgi:hypothetical protein